MVERDPGRANQKRRTRKDLLQAAARLIKQGRKPSLEEIAAEAMVSRATAYRYFPNVETLLLEAPLDLAVPDATTLFADCSPTDVVQRLVCVDDMFHDFMLENEAPLRLFLANALTAQLDPERKHLPARQNRRSPLIEAALAPQHDAFEPEALDKLSKALAIIIATEAMVVFKDVLQVEETEARKIKRWAIRALVEAALKDTSGRRAGAS